MKSIEAISQQRDAQIRRCAIFEAEVVRGRAIVDTFQESEKKLTRENQHLAEKIERLEEKINAREEYLERVIEKRETLASENADLTQELTKLRKTLAHVDNELNIQVETANNVSIQNQELIAKLESMANTSSTATGPTTGTTSASNRASPGRGHFGHDNPPTPSSDTRKSIANLGHSININSNSNSNNNTEMLRQAAMPISDANILQSQPTRSHGHGHGLFVETTQASEDASTEVNGSSKNIHRDSKISDGQTSHRKNSNIMLASTSTTAEIETAMHDDLSNDFIPPIQIMLN
jgi:regulator of replication initiation timing